MSETESRDGRPPNEDESSPNRAQLRYQTSRALSEAGFGDVFVLPLEKAKDVLTPNRRELLNTLAGESVDSVSDLARKVGRDTGNVSRDLDLLAKYDLIEYQTEGADKGTPKRPVLSHDAIITEPVGVQTTPAYE